MCPRAAIAALILAWVPGLAGTGYADGPSSPPVVPAPEITRWGVNDVHVSTGPLPVDDRLSEDDILMRARRAGLGWVRYQVFWHLVNPERDVYDWRALDVEMARLVAAGFNILMQVSYPPAWTTGVSHPNEVAAVFCLVDGEFPDIDADRDGVRDHEECLNEEFRPGHDPRYRTVDAEGRTVGTYPPDYDRSRDFRRFVRALLQRYGQHVKAWSFGVEAHTKVFWRGTVRQLVDEVLRPGYEEVKAVDPSLLVVGPDQDVEDTLDLILKLEQDDLASGRPPLFDVLAFHVFAHSGWITPDQLDREWRGGDGGIDCMFERPGDRLCSLREVVTRYGRGRPLWLTEFGYRVADPFDPGAADRATAWFTAWIRGIKARPWIDKAFFFSLRHDYVDPPGDFGLFMNDDAATPVPAVTAIARELAAHGLPVTRYLAEGATGPLFDLDVALANPGDEPAPVAVRFLKPGGDVVAHWLTVAPRSRETIRVDRLRGLEDTAVSTVVTSTLGLPLLVERTMFWDASYYGGHGGSAVEAPQRRWYFAEGAQGFFDTFVLLANANPRPAQVTVRFLREGEPPVVVERSVPPNARENIWAVEIPELDGQAFAIVVDSDVPIIAERAMYFPSLPWASRPGSRTRFWEGGHESAGVPAPSRTWFHAEGATGDLFDEYILVGNPNDDPAEVTFTFLLSSGETVVATRIIPPQSRYTLNVEAASDFAALDLLTIVSGEAERLRRAEVSTTVTANVPVVSERAMYWSGGFDTWHEAHNSFGVTETATRWGLAEGRVGGPVGFETWILLANPSPVPTTVRVTLLRQSGAPPIWRDFLVAPTSRFNVYVNDEQWAALGLRPGESFGAIIESRDPALPIAVERAMYWSTGGLFWSGGTNATATRLP